jgi:hypothetical protein
MARSPVWLTQKLARHHVWVKAEQTDKETGEGGQATSNGDACRTPRKLVFRTPSAKPTSHPVDQATGRPAYEADQASRRSDAPEVSLAGLEGKQEAERPAGQLS